MRLAARLNAWRTDTIYTANIVNGEHAGTVSMINGDTCTGTTHTGCQHAAATVHVGFGASAVGIDPATDAVYVTNIEDSSVSVINGHTCKRIHTMGCGQTPPKIAVGDYPDAIAIAIATDAAACTAYVSNCDNTVSGHTAGSPLPLSHSMPQNPG